jgi:hypothetical protein
VKSNAGALLFGIFQRGGALPFIAGQEIALVLLFAEAVQGSDTVKENFSLAVVEPVADHHLDKSGRAGFYRTGCIGFWNDQLGQYSHDLARGLIEHPLRSPGCRQRARQHLL